MCSLASQRLEDTHCSVYLNRCVSSVDPRYLVHVYPINDAL
jgi:hypothetical protein